MGRGARARARAEREAAEAEYDWQWQLITYVAFIGLGWFIILWHIASGDATVQVRSDLDLPATTAVCIWTLLTLIGGVPLWWARRRS